MKRFTCNCIEEQFKSPDKVYVGLTGKSEAMIPCVYKPKDKVTLRQARLETNFCPVCGAKLEEIN